MHRRKRVRHTALTGQLHIAMNRFGLGASAADLQAARTDPQSWVLRQLDGPMPRTESALDSQLALRQSRRLAQARRAAELKGDVEALEGAQAELRRLRLADVAARYNHLVQTTKPLLARLGLFWANHFAISAETPVLRLLPGPFEREAIFPHVLGRFEDMLLAVCEHPAMLLYLNNDQSFGPDSMVASRHRKRIEQGMSMRRARIGLNENLAREVLELHTLGVNGGYAQEDVQELARGLTGWSIRQPRIEADDAASRSVFRFKPQAHQPGARRLLGRSFAEAGQAQGREMLQFLARQPATADFVSRKLVIHLCGDAPDEALVRNAAEVFLATDGDLAAVVRNILEASRAWSPDLRKFRSPREFLIAGLRLSGRELNPNQWFGWLRLLGQPPDLPRSPAGWPDQARNWISSDALWKRVQIAERLTTVSGPGVEPLMLAQMALGDQLKSETRLAISRAPDRRMATTLCFSCPEFQWR